MHGFTPHSSHRIGMVEQCLAISCFQHIGLSLKDIPFGVPIHGAQKLIDGYPDSRSCRSCSLKRWWWGVPVENGGYPTQIYIYIYIHAYSMVLQYFNGWYKLYKPWKMGGGFYSLVLTTTWPCRWCAQSWWMWVVNLNIIWSSGAWFPTSRLSAD